MIVGNQLIEFAYHRLHVCRIGELEVNVREFAVGGVQVLDHVQWQEDVGQLSRLHYASYVPIAVEELQRASRMHLGLLREVGVDQNIVRFFKAMSFAEGKSAAHLFKLRYIDARYRGPSRDQVTGHSSRQSHVRDMFQTVDKLLWHVGESEGADRRIR